MKKIFKQIAFIFLLTFTFQMFGCGGADVQSAKLYRQQRDYKRANAMLEQALKSDPQSDEGWALYMLNLYDLNQYEKISEYIDTARTYAFKNRAMVELVGHNTWVNLYNGGVNAFQQNPDSKEQQQAAIGLLESAKKLAPDQPETYEVLGDVYYAAGDTAKGIATYQEALAHVRTVHDQGVALGLRMRMEPSEVETAVGGSPSKDTAFVYYGSDSVRVYSYRSNDGFFYFERAPKPPRKWQLTGWRFTNIQDVGLLPMRVSTAPYQAIGNYYYNKGNAVLASNKTKAEEYYIDEAVPMFMAIQSLDPSDERAFALITDIFTKLKQPEKLKAVYEKMLNLRPSKSMYVAYGATLSNSGDFEGAISSFEKALALDPAYGIALYDLGATYRSWAAAEQKNQPPPPPVDKKNPKPPPQTNDPVRTKLEKSTDYFERDIALNKKDYNAYFNLLDNYDILGKKEKIAPMVANLDAMKNTDAAKEVEFWDTLGKIYVRVNRAEDSANAFKKADQMRGK